MKTVLWWQLIFIMGYHVLYSICSRGSYLIIIILAERFLASRIKFFDIVSFFRNWKKSNFSHLLINETTKSHWEKAETVQEDEEQIFQDVTPPSSRIPWCVLLALSWNTNHMEQMKIQVQISWVGQSTNFLLNTWAQKKCSAR